MSTHDNIADGLQHLAVSIDSLTLDPDNARKHDKRNLAAIKSSLEQFGYRQPLVVQKQGMIVRAGNGRVMASMELGWTHVPALIVDEGEAEAIAYAIADNRTAELAEWDVDVLAQLLTDLRDSPDSDFDLSTVGFSDAELNVLLVEDMWGDADDSALNGEDNDDNAEPTSHATGGVRVVFAGSAKATLEASYEKNKTEDESVTEFILRHLPGGADA